MMIRGKELSQNLCNKTVEQHRKGKGYRLIPQLLNVPISTTGAIICKWKQHHSTINWLGHQGAVVSPSLAASRPWGGS